jgi:hypothetical protein
MQTAPTDAPLDGSKSLWQHGVDRGFVSDSADGQHRLRVTGFVFDDAQSYISGEERAITYTNKPQFITVEFAMMLFRRAFKDAFEDRWARLQDGQAIRSNGNEYRLETQ